jgi:hypothetical protein
MKWIKASERFPDDWEHKHLRYSFDHYVVEGSLFEHRDDALCKIGGTGRLEYHQFEWLDESEPPAPAGEWKELTEAAEIVKELAEWSKRYPRGNIYGMSGKENMDGQLIAIEERAKLFINQSNIKQ